jgi:glucose-6-phosphate 1-dehydrogenase
MQEIRAGNDHSEALVGNASGAMPDRPTLLILGASGDLTARLLLPGLAGLLAAGGGEGLGLLGAGMEAWDDRHWRAHVSESFAAAHASGGRLHEVAATARYQQADVTRQDDLRRLLQACDGQVIIYFALPPPVTAAACKALTEIELPQGTRLALEKPFGIDADSAAALNAVLAQLVPEDQVHRVDHFLGKSTVLNVLGVRFANRILEPVLNAAHVERVDIIFDEALGLEGRAGYYDGAGARVDMSQSHLLQVLSLLAMEPPSTLHPRDFRDAKSQALRATRVWDDDARAASRRARYTAGDVGGRTLPAYVDEPGVDSARDTEPLAEVVLAVDTWRWAGVPFRLRSGKALGTARKEVVVTFRPPPWVPTGLRGHDQPNQLLLGMTSDIEHLGLHLNVNGPGDPFTVDPVSLEADFGTGELPPYGEVLEGILANDPTLLVRGDTAVECWRIVEPVLEAWRAGDVKLEEYPAGGGGPWDD